MCVGLFLFCLLSQHHIMDCIEQNFTVFLSLILFALVAPVRGESFFTSPMYLSVEKFLRNFSPKEQILSKPQSSGQFYESMSFHSHFLTDQIFIPAFLRIFISFFLD